MMLRCARLDLFEVSDFGESRIILAYDRAVQGESRPWSIGDIANGHILTAGNEWVRITAAAHPAGPWAPGDIVNAHAFTGTTWVAMPAGWQSVQMPPQQFDWWAGRSWDQAPQNPLNAAKPRADALSAAGGSVRAGWTFTVVVAAIIAGLYRGRKYLYCAAIAVGGAWLSVRFDNPDILYATGIVVFFGLIFAWVFN